MKFIVKDLMISVLPLRASGGVPVLGCDAGTSCACSCTPCSGTCSPCSDCSKCTTGTPGFESWWETIVDPEQIAVLKQQLKERLAMLEAREQQIVESLRPKSAIEIETLQAHLTAALDSLKHGGKNKG